MHNWSHQKCFDCGLGLLGHGGGGVDDVDHMEGMHMCSSLACVAGVEVLMMLITWMHMCSSLTCVAEVEVLMMLITWMHMCSSLACVARMEC